MPFKKIDIDQIIEHEKQKDPHFAKEWEESRDEYRLLEELVKIRRERNLSQSDLAAMTGNKQQVISRIEKRQCSPTLKTFCKILYFLGYEIKLIPKT